MNNIKTYKENGKIVIEENGIKYDYINPLYDKAFKTILKADKNYYIIKTLLKEFLHVDLIEIHEKDSEFEAYGINEKQERCDYLIRVNDKVIQIECNKVYSRVLKERNISHFRRLIKEYGFPAIQVNFDDYDVGKKNKLVYHYSLKSDEDESFYKDMIEIFHINLLNVEKISYNEIEINKLSNMERICLMFKTRTRKDMAVLVKGDENLMDFKNIYEEIANDKELVDEYTKEELEKLAYGDESAKKEKKKIAKNLLNKKVDIDIISSSTGLTIEEIEKLK